MAARSFARAPADTESDERAARRAERAHEWPEALALEQALAASPSTLLADGGFGQPGRERIGVGLVQRLQCSFGNQAVQSFLQTGASQTGASPPMPAIQRQAAAPAAPTPPRAESPAPAGAIASTGLGLIVDDSAQQLQPGQMKRTEFLSQLRIALDNTVDESLAGKTWVVAAHALLDQGFKTYSAQDNRSLEQALRVEASGAAIATARDYIPIVRAHLRQTIGLARAGTSAVQDLLAWIGKLLFGSRGGPPTPLPVWVTQVPQQQRLSLRMYWYVEMEPASSVVPVGKTVTFRLRNSLDYFEFWEPEPVMGERMPVLTITQEGAEDDFALAPNDSKTDRPTVRYTFARPGHLRAVFSGKPVEAEGGLADVGQEIRVSVDLDVVRDLTAQTMEGEPCQATSRADVNQLEDPDASDPEIAQAFQRIAVRRAIEIVNRNRQEAEDCTPEARRKGPPSRQPRRFSACCGSTPDCRPRSGD